MRASGHPPRRRSLTVSSTRAQAAKRASRCRSSDSEPIRLYRKRPVRFIDAFVDSLDLEEAGFQRVRPNDKGRPGYDPADLLKLYIYGYLNRVRSSRRLEAETHRNLAGC